jgi:hypothetical protein
MSLFSRWVWKEESAEIYFEYGYHDRKSTVREYLLNPEDGRAFIFGLRKFFPLRGEENQGLQAGMEVSQLQQTSLQKIQQAEAWYSNKYIRHGYTHRGEPLGAGVGPGANHQSLDLNWIDGINRIGLQVERYIHNNDFYYYGYQDSQDWRRHWFDLSVSASGDWSFQQFSLNGSLGLIKSYNYQTYLLQEPGQPYVVNGLDKWNIQLKFGAAYNFNGRLTK